MPRHPRLDASGTVHHIIGRGISGTKVFATKKDKAGFLLRVAERCTSDGLIVYAWVVMDTHFHLLARTNTTSISSIMRKILTGYAVNFNRRHKRYGHVFQNRFKSIICEEDPYLLSLLKPIRIKTMPFVMGPPYPIFHLWLDVLWIKKGSAFLIFSPE